ncbi:hypothetical protein DFJ73DRAFT_855074 [Zopfochytrium polystomum]|nr:hypothetical protein DFJ73DRAFT_855074 [Zopfochytrium polystomum]
MAANWKKSRPSDGSGGGGGGGGGGDAANYSNSRNNPNTIRVPKKQDAVPSGTIVGAGGSSFTRGDSNDQSFQDAPDSGDDRGTRRTALLLDEDFDDDDDDGTVNPKDAKDRDQLTISRSYAQRYEERKRAEELSLLREKYGDGEVDDLDDDDDADDEEEDEVGALVSADMDAQIFRTIGLIRSKDPSVYDPSKSFYSSEIGNFQGGAASQKRADKKFTIKDFHRERLLNSNGDDSGDEAEVGGEIPATFASEQESLRNAFKAAAAAIDADEEIDGDANGSANHGGIFSLREKSKAELEREEEEYRQFLVQNLSKGEGAEGIKDWLSYAKGEGDSTIENEDDKFLLDYILKRGWVDKEANAIPTYDDIVRDEHIDEDEAKDDMVDDFEREYNFRFEEEGADNIVTYSRDVPNSMRRKDTKRSEARKAAKSRKEEEAAQKAEELKRLKQLKKQEILERLKKAAKVAGVVPPASSKSTGKTSASNDDAAAAAVSMFFDDKDVELLEGDFDPDKWDQMMSKKFNDDYYKAPDAEIPVDMEGDEEGDWPLEADGPEWAGFEDEDEDFEISGIVDSDLKPKAGKESVRLKQAPVKNRLEQLEEMEEQKQQYQGYDEAYDDEDADFIMDADYLPGGAYYTGDGAEEPATGKKTKKEKKKKKKVELPKNLEDYLEDYYQLDYEDMIGDLPTRFKYRKVDAETFGLEPEEVLKAPEEALNTLMPLKRLAPFRPAHKVKHDREIFKKHRKKRLAQFREMVKKIEEEAQAEKEEELAAQRKLGQAAKKALKRKRSTAGADAILERDTDPAAAPASDVSSVAVPQETESTSATSKQGNNSSATKEIGENGKKAKKPGKDKQAAKAGPETKMKISKDRLASYAMPSKKRH